MSNSDTSSEVKTKNITFGLVFAWLFGIVVGIAGIVTLFTNIIIGILYLIAAVIILPPTYRVIKNKLHVSLSKGLRAAIVIIIFIIIGSLIVQSSGSQTTTTSSNTVTAPVQSSIKVTANQLMSDYTANEVSADAKYKNNLVQVSGIVDSIGKDIIDTPYITLKAGSEYSISVVQCMFAKSDESALATVSKGEQMTLVGQVTGKLGNVILNGCKIEQ